MSDDYQTQVKTVLHQEGFLHLTFSGAQRGATVPWEKVTVRPVLVKRARALQFSYFDKKKDVSRNFTVDEAIVQLEELLALPFTHIHLQTTTGDMHVRVTKKGKVLVTRGKPSRAEAAPDLAHDHQKRYPLLAADAFLQAIGISDSAGRVRPARRGKFHQISEFLRLLEGALDEQTLATPLHIIDLGCGNACLTFAAYHYLNDVRGLPARVVGVDRNEEVIVNATRERDALGWTDLEFVVRAIDDYQPATRPDIVLSLHACDTATDDALAQGVRWQSQVILAAPCCQHELHDQLRHPLFQPVLRHGALRQRMADVLTDSLRALLLRILGYRTEVIEFTDPEHTAKNLMIRAVRGLPPGEKRFIQEYEELCRFWNITPYLHTQLISELTAVGVPLSHTPAEAP